MQYLARYQAAQGHEQDRELKAYERRPPATHDTNDNGYGGGAGAGWLGAVVRAAVGVVTPSIYSHPRIHTR